MALAVGVLVWIGLTVYEVWRRGIGALSVTTAVVLGVIIRAIWMRSQAGDAEPAADEPPKD